ncbi:MAG: PHP domain-containing protein [Deltaproteobacteria bacterium]|nr:PHP domain-containing protein [Deltaproteobacteria bacterium]
MSSQFMRSKLINVCRLDNNTLVVHGVLDDSIYSLELDFKVELAGLGCFDVEGRWLRWTTPECPRSLEFIRLVEGLKLTDPVSERVHKTLGRRSCRHYANLFLEMVYAVRETVRMLELDLPGAALSEPEPPAEADEAGDEPEKVSSTVASPERTASRGFSQKPAGGFIVDLHLHTAPASPCASDSVAEMIVVAKKRGLDGICLTDHNYLWSEKEVQKLRERHDFLILRGNEVVTDQGDMLVFGFHEEIRGVVRLRDLKEQVAARGGFIIAAHPFRGFLTFAADDIGLTVESASRREMFKWVDGVEVLNGRVTENENRLAREVAAALHLPATGGSDAHQVSEVGRCATLFPAPFHDETGLVAALRSGDYRPLSLSGD